MAKFDNEYEDTIEGGSGACDEYFEPTYQEAKRKLKFGDDDIQEMYDEIYEDYEDI